MKIYLVLLYVLFCVIGLSQVPKKQIGTSVYYKNGILVSDSLVTHVVTFDSIGNKKTESMISLDENGEFIDSSFYLYDLAGRTIYQYSGRENWYYKFDDRGTILEVRAYREHDTIINIFTPKYKHGKLIELSVEYNGNISIRTYSYEKRTTIVDYAGQLTTIEKRDKKGGLIYVQSITKYTGVHIIETHTITRNSSGAVTSFKKEIDGELIKLTTHEYENGLEKVRTQTYYKPEHVVVITYRYEYW